MVKVPKGYRSKNVRDTRSVGGSSRGSGGLGGFGRSTSRSSSRGGLGASRPQGQRGGCGIGFLIMLAVLAFLLFSCFSGGTAGDPLGVDTGANTTAGGNTATDATAPAGSNSESAQEEAAFDLINFVLDDLQEEFWPQEFEEASLTYRDATVNVFEQGVSTGGCGNATSAVGPFYCPADETAYIDIEYMFLLQDRLGAEGDFSQAYILAHEVGHHVQTLLGINQALRAAQSGASTTESNALQVALELQADCFAGAWAFSFADRGFLDTGDLEEGIGAASAVGDDAITGSSNQENFTHGSSAQRVEWFMRGFDEGTDSCGTFDGEMSPG